MPVVAVVHKGEGYTGGGGGSPPPTPPPPTQQGEYGHVVAVINRGSNGGTGNNVSPQPRPSTPPIGTSGYIDAQGNAHIVSDYTGQGGGRYDTVVGGYTGGYSGSGFQRMGATNVSQAERAQAATGQPLPSSIVGRTLSGQERDALHNTPIGAISDPARALISGNLDVRSPQGMAEFNQIPVEKQFAVLGAMGAKTESLRGSTKLTVSPSGQEGYFTIFGTPPSPGPRTSTPPTPLGVVPIAAISAVSQSKLGVLPINTASGNLTIPKDYTYYKGVVEAKEKQYSNNTANTSVLLGGNLGAKVTPVAEALLMPSILVKAVGTAYTRMLGTPAEAAQAEKNLIIARGQYYERSDEAVKTLPVPFVTIPVDTKAMGALGSPVAVGIGIAETLPVQALAISYGAGGIVGATTRGLAYSGGVISKAAPLVEPVITGLFLAKGGSDIYTAYKTEGMGEAVGTAAVYGASLPFAAGAYSAGKNMGTSAVNKVAPSITTNKPIEAPSLSQQVSELISPKKVKFDVLKSVESEKVATQSNDYLQPVVSEKTKFVTEKVSVPLEVVPKEVQPDITRLAGKPPEGGVQTGAYNVDYAKTLSTDFLFEGKNRGIITRKGGAVTISTEPLTSNIMKSLRTEAGKGVLEISIKPPEASTKAQIELSPEYTNAPIEYTTRVTPVQGKTTVQRYGIEPNEGTIGIKEIIGTEKTIAKVKPSNYGIEVFPTARAAEIAKAAEEGTLQELVNREAGIKTVKQQVTESPTVIRLKSVVNKAGEQFNEFLANEEAQIKFKPMPKSEGETLQQMQAGMEQYPGTTKTRTVVNPRTGEVETLIYNSRTNTMTRLTEITGEPAPSVELFPNAPKSPTLAGYPIRGVEITGGRVYNFGGLNVPGFPGFGVTPLKSAFSNAQINTNAIKPSIEFKTNVRERMNTAQEIYTGQGNRIINIPGTDITPIIDTPTVTIITPVPPTEIPDIVIKPPTTMPPTGWPPYRPPAWIPPLFPAAGSSGGGYTPRKKKRQSTFFTKRVNPILEPFTEVKGFEDNSGNITTLFKNTKARRQEAPKQKRARKSKTIKSELKRLTSL